MNTHLKLAELISDECRLRENGCEIAKKLSCKHLYENNITSVP